MRTGQANHPDTTHKGYGCTGPIAGMHLELIVQCPNVHFRWNSSHAHAQEIPRHCKKIEQSGRAAAENHKLPIHKYLFQLLVPLCSWLAFAALKLVIFWSTESEMVILWSFSSHTVESEKSVIVLQYVTVTFFCLLYWEAACQERFFRLYTFPGRWKTPRMTQTSRWIPSHFPPRPPLRAGYCAGYGPVRALVEEISTAENVVPAVVGETSGLAS